MQFSHQHGTASASSEFDRWFFIFYRAGHLTWSRGLFIYKFINVTHYSMFMHNPFERKRERETSARM